MFLPGLRNILNILIFAFLGIFLLTGILFWKLTTGPISLTFLTPYFEKVLNEALNNKLEVELDETVLVWGGWENNIDIRLRGTKAIDVMGKIVAQIPELAVTLSPIALVEGKLAPQSISIFDLRLNILRNSSGKIEVGPVNYNKESDGLISKELNLFEGLIGDLLVKQDPAKPLSHLKYINIIRGNVFFDDQKLEVKWNAPDTDIRLSRDSDTLSIIADLMLKSDNATTQEPTAINLVGNYSINTKKAKITLGFNNLNPRNFALFSQKLKPLKFFDLPLNGTLDAVILKNGEIPRFDFNFEGEAGKFGIDKNIDISMTVENAKFRGNFNQNTGILRVDNFQINLGDDGILKIRKPITHDWKVRQLSLIGSYYLNYGLIEIDTFQFKDKDSTFDTTATIQEFDDEFSFEIGVKASNLLVNNMSEVWPESWHRVIRTWLVENLNDGVIDGAQARFSGTYNVQKGIKIKTSLGSMSYKNMSIDYLDSMPRATHGVGHIKFNENKFEVFISKGKSGSLNIKAGRIVFSGLNNFDQYADVDINLEGPLGPTINVLSKNLPSSNRLSELSKRNIKADLNAKLKLNFLVETKTTIQMVTGFLSAKLKNVGIPKLPFNLEFLEGDLNLIADNKSMKITGSGNLGGAKTDIVWEENFLDNNAYARKYSFISKLVDKIWAKNLGLDFIPFTDDFITGKVGVRLNVQEKRSGYGELTAYFDLKDTDMYLPRFNWRKSRKVQANATLLASFKGNKFISIPSILVQGGGLDFKGNLSFKNDGGIKKISINRLVFGRTNIRAIMAPKPINLKGGWDIDISGKSIDLIQWLATNDEQNTSKRKGMYTLSLNIDNAEIYDGKRLENVNGVLSFDGLVWTDINLEARLDGAKKLKVSLTPKDGKRYLYISSNDAGSLLKVFDYYDDLIGGTFSLNGKYNGMSPYSKFSGHVRIDDFRVINAPILAELLNVASITGILENLQGIGLGFAKLYAPFVSEDEIIKIKGASVSGLSLGLTATGTLNTYTENMDLRGTIVPMYALNTALTRIPIIGTLFSGGEKDGGIFAANYTMRGSPKEPQISSNPLSVVAPGLLRNLFRIFDNPESAPSQN